MAHPLVGRCRIGFILSSSGIRRRTSRCRRCGQPQSLLLQRLVRWDVGWCVAQAPVAAAGRTAGARSVSRSGCEVITGSGRFLGRYQDRGSGPGRGAMGRLNTPRYVRPVIPAGAGLPGELLQPDSCIWSAEWEGRGWIGCKARGREVRVLAVFLRV